MNKITYEDVKTRISMYDILEKYGIELKGSRGVCPIHGGDNKTALSVHDQGRLWTCHTKGCGKASSNVDFVMLMENISSHQAFIKIKEMFNLVDEEPVKKKKKPPRKQVGSPKFYDYTTADGDLAYQMRKTVFDDGSKIFKPIQINGREDLEGVDRVLYNLRSIINNDESLVYLAEGEKTADALIAAGYLGTTCAMGCNGWKEIYVDSLKDRNVVLLPDADEAGEKWLKKVSESLAGHVESTVTVYIPDDFIMANEQFTGHDFSDYCEINGREAAIEFLDDAVESSVIVPRGVDRSSLNVATDICKKALEDIKAGRGGGIMDMRRIFGPMMDVDVMEGDVVMIIAPTGVGKTRILHNIPIEFTELNFMVFDLELTPAILGRRYIAMHNNLSFKQVQPMVASGEYDIKSPTLENIFLPKVPQLTTAKIKAEVDRVESITGRRINVIGIDYVAKMNRMGNATESIEAHCSAFKNYCSMEERVGIITTQCSRGHDKADFDYKMPNKEDAIHSSAIEQSCQEAFCFHLKSINDRQTMVMKCDKYSHGDMPSGKIEIAANNLVLKYLGQHQDQSGGSW